MNETTIAATDLPDGPLGALDEAEPCDSSEDVFGLSGRMLIGRVLRPYLDAHCLTPTEVLHSHKALTALLAQRVLVEASIERVAAVQGRIPGQDPRRRAEAILTTLDEVAERTARLEATLAGAAGRGPPFAVLQRDRGLRPGESAEGDALLLAAVCRELVGMRGWMKKLGFLVSLSRDDPEGRVAALLDGAIADLLGVGALVAELFGPTPTLGDSLRRNLELALTPLAQPPGVTDPPLVGLNQLLLAGRLPVTRASLLERALRQVRAPAPLGSGPREEEIRLFHDILSVVATPDGVAGGGAMAEALVARYARRLDHEGAEALCHAMAGVVETLPNLFSRLHFLAALAPSGMGAGLANELALLVDTQFLNETLLESAVFKPFDPGDLGWRLEGAAAAFERAGLPDDVKARLRGRITGLVDAFVMRGGFLDLMDAAEPNPARRIEALRAVVTAGLVTVYGAAPLIEDHIGRLTARPAGDPVPPVPRFAADGPPGPDARVIARFGRHRCPNCFESKGGAGMCLICGHDEGEGARPGVHLTPGSTLQGRYVVGRLIGQGGYGATYLGWDERLAAKVAIKEYFPVSLAGRSPGTGALTPYTDELVATFKDGVVKFLDEARILSRLTNVREIVEVKDAFEANGTAYMIMELLVGRTLQRHLLEEGGSLDYRRALALILPIAKAVHDVHRLGLVHRDISPDNIFLLDRGGAKLLDFGAARHFVGEATGALTVILKRGYAPPEQYSASGHQGPWTDVYALCATFYCAITGRPPPEAVSRLAGDDGVPRPSALGIAIPAAIEDALIGGLALGWEERPRDMRALLQSFNRALS